MTENPDDATPDAIESTSPEQSIPEQSRDAIDTSDLIEGYHAISEWIRFADAKAAVVLALGGAVGGLVVPTLKAYLAEDQSIHPAHWWTTLVGVMFAIWLLLLVLSGICAFLCILPFRRKGRHPALDDCKHFHPAAISAHYKLNAVEDFSKRLSTLGNEGLRQEVAACMLIDSHISASKYHFVTASIRFMGISAIAGMIYLVLIQF
ncbi:MAG: hypothetical protein AAFV88_19180 [Planctomycetota bacterium]